MTKLAPLFDRKASYVDSIWGGNKSAIVLLQEDRAKGRIDIPKASGNDKQDSNAIKKVQQQVRAWISGGILPENNGI